MQAVTGDQKEAHDRLARTKQHIVEQLSVDCEKTLKHIVYSKHSCPSFSDSAKVTRSGGWLRRSCSCLLLGVMLSISAAAVMAQQNLPDMGEPADNALSPNEERQLGAQFMRQIRSQLPIIRDVQLSEYIQSLGTQLAHAAGKSDAQDFTFFLIDDPQINAFAIPGGYVGVNSGLIAVMGQEEQLASVVAHEVAHVTQRHHARAFATGNRATLSTAAAILAAIIIGQASPQAGQAALAAGLAASQQSAINFTRSNEVEADRIGIEILANAGYDSRAMAESFSILRKKNSLNTSDLQLEYLRTHPLDNNRIAEATDRADNKPHIARLNSPDYALFRARLAVLSASDSSELMRTYLAQYQRKPTVGSSYALALIHQRANRPDDAKRYLKELDTLISANPMVELLRADIAGLNNQRSDDAVLSALSELYPERYSIVEKRLDQLTQDRRLGQAKQVATHYLRNTSNPDPLAWRQLASIQEQLDDQAGSHESLARYFEALDELGRATSQLELALRQVPAASQDKLRLEASLKELRNKATSLR
ncbi:M48 family metalloprotease [Granulosicoccus antarcticus]|uniref:beta-barrel assembly-enhancing protease n=1 Tax=Granulosicoccus antarcticus TaxID=437505 RepID=UPI0012FDDB56|nr:M48 family metalloprotease [Granulosicoccus antarcticus]